MSGKVYEADGPIIRKLPVETKTETGVKISIGFPVCRLTEWCDDQGEAVAEIMNRGEAYASSQAEIERLKAALSKVANEVFGLSAFEAELRSVMGNTNWNVLQQRAEEARAALSGSKE